MNAATMLPYALGGVSGGIIGLVLGLIGGGGSILAVPLIINLVGVRDPHMAIGTSACAVAANAGVNLIPHARAGNVDWRNATLFAGAGVIGAAIGASFGRSVDGNRLLALFSLLMLLVAWTMSRRPASRPENSRALSNRAPRPLRTAGTGALVGLLAGFFGIGGGFLIVPGLMLATGMPMLLAVGSSLVAVACFGLTTAVTYALAGMVDWGLVAAFIVGGLAGGAAGCRLAGHFFRREDRLLNRIFSVMVMLVALFMLWKSLKALMG